MPGNPGEAGPPGHPSHPGVSFSQRQLAVDLSLLKKYARFTENQTRFDVSLLF